MQSVGQCKIKSTILAAQVKYLETGLVSAFSQPQSSLQILSSFSRHLYCKDKERKEKKKSVITHKPSLKQH